jgi:hypothetical protein
MKGRRGRPQLLPCEGNRGEEKKATWSVTLRSPEATRSFHERTSISHLFTQVPFPAPHAGNEKF